MTPRPEGNPECNAALFAGFLRGDVERTYGHLAQAANPEADTSQACTGTHYPPCEILPTPACSREEECTGILPTPACSREEECTAILPTPACSREEECTGILPTPACSREEECTGILPTPACSREEECTGILPTPACSGECTGTHYPRCPEPPKHASWFTGV